MASAFYIYALFRRDTGQPFYIGKGSGHRWIVHECPSSKANPHKKNIIKAMRDAGLSVPKVKLADGLTEDEAFSIERAFIAAIGRAPNGPLVNQTDGGEGTAGRQNRAQIDRLADWHRGQKRPDSWRLAISEALRGRALSLDAIEKMANSKRGKPLSQEHRDRIAAGNRGKPLSADRKAKISAAQKGKSRPSRGPLSEETKARISAANRGKKRTAESRALMSEVGKQAWARRKDAINANN